MSPSAPWSYAMARWWDGMLSMKPLYPSVIKVLRLLGESQALTIGREVVPIWADIAIVLALGTALIAIATRFFGQVE